MTVEDPIVVFLCARFDEDERVVRVDPGHSQEWHTETARDDPRDEGRACVRSSQGDVITGDVDIERAEHIAHYDPARMLREVEAKRRIVADHHITTGVLGGQALQVCARCSDFVDRGELFRVESAPCRTLRILTLPYADHDDYQEEWRP